MVQRIPNRVEARQVNGATVLVGAGGNIRLNKSVPGMSCCILGDSFGERNYPLGGTPAWGWMDYGYWVWSNLLLGSPFRLLKNGGVAGQTSAQVLLRVQTDVIDYAPDWCFYLASVNDTGAGLVAADTIANQQAAIMQMINAGINVCVLAICPYTSNADATKNIHLVNRAMAEYCAVTAGSVFVDTYAAMVDPSSTTGALAAGMTDDSLHPSAKGARAMGTVIAAALSPHIKSTLLLPSSMSESYSISTSENQLLANPLFTGSGGIVSGVGASGTAATDWTFGIALGAATTVGSVAARTVANDGDTIGNNQVLSISSAGSGALVNCRLASNHYARVVEGDTCYFAGHIQLESPVDVAYVRASMVLVVGGIAYNIRVMQESNTTYDNTGFSLKFRTADFVIPAGACTVFQCRTDVGFGTSGAGSAVMKLGRAGLYRVPA